jgi:two-component system sensor histidine kinase QseC
MVRLPMDMQRSVITIIEELAPLAAQKNIALSFEGGEHLFVMADETLLRLLIGNVIENAIKYTPEKGFVEVALHADEAAVICTVTDSGPGIPEPERANVFQRFYRVGTPQAQGTGLGLAIVAETVARLSGTIALGTPANGTGLMVTMRLPRAHTVPAA